MSLLFRPKGSYLLIEPVAEEETAKGGIIIPDTAKEKPTEGVVIATGPGRVTDYGFEIPNQYREGDHVLYGRYAGTEITIEGRRFLIMREEEVFGDVIHVGDDDKEIK